jgi:CHAT domain-containing protein
LPEILVASELSPDDRQAKLPAQPPSLLLVGDVDFGADPGSGDTQSLDRIAARGGEQFNWPSLRGTRDEVASIQASYVKQFHDAQPTILAQGQATKSAVSGAMARCEYIHFSTHGFFAPAKTTSPAEAISIASTEPLVGFVTSQDVSGYQPGLLSGLVLAGANRRPASGKEDGILTALEVEEMDLWRVKLATLSACETGLGQTAGGEGLLGLQRAFQTAGAKAVVASLWKVPDKATQMLMSRFYDNLWNKRLSKIESLREAQRWLLHEGSKQPDITRGLDLSIDPAEEEPQPSGQLPPLYWAAFELSGDWR